MQWETQGTWAPWLHNALVNQFGAKQLGFKNAQIGAGGPGVRLPIFRSVSPSLTIILDSWSQKYIPESGMYLAAASQCAQ